METSSYIESLPLAQDVKRRISMTVSCEDCSSIKKVVNAGKTFSTNDFSYQVMHNGLKIIEGGYHGRAITEIIRLLHGHHEPQEEKAFYEILKYIKPGSTMIELGSHWSYYSMWFQKEVRDAINYMVEPDPNNIEVGKYNFNLNNMNGTFYNASIGRNSSASTAFECESDNKIRNIPRVSLDDLIENNDINYVDLLFADIQGYEYQMLEGAVTSIANRKIRFIFLSTHHHLISNDPIIHHRCLDFLKKNKAHIIVSHTVTESYSGDGLIVASFLESDRNIPEISISRNYPTNSLFREIEFDFEEARLEIERLSLQLKLAEQSIASHLDKNERGLRARIANKLKTVFGYLQ